MTRKPPSVWLLESWWQMADEYILGEVSSENHYNPNAIAPTIDELYTAAVESGANLITVTPFGKVGSPKRQFGSTSAIIQVGDIMAVSRAMAGIGDVSQMTAEQWVHWGDMIRDPRQTGPILKELLNLQYDPIHITGIGFKVVS